MTHQNQRSNFPFCSPIFSCFNIRVTNRKDHLNRLSCKFYNSRQALIVEFAPMFSQF